MQFLFLKNLIFLQKVKREKLTTFVNESVDLPYNLKQINKRKKLKKIKLTFGRITTVAHCSKGSFKQLFFERKSKNSKNWSNMTFLLLGISKTISLKNPDPFFPIGDKDLWLPVGDFIPEFDVDGEIDFWLPFNFACNEGVNIFWAVVGVNTALLSLSFLFPLVFVGVEGGEDNFWDDNKLFSSALSSFALNLGQNSTGTIGSGKVIKKSLNIFATTAQETTTDVWSVRQFSLKQLNWFLTQRNAYFSDSLKSLKQFDMFSGQILKNAMLSLKTLGTADPSLFWIISIGV